MAGGSHASGPSDVRDCVTLSCTFRFWPRRLPKGGRCFDELLLSPPMHLKASVQSEIKSTYFGLGASNRPPAQLKINIRLPVVFQRRAFISFGASRNRAQAYVVLGPRGCVRAGEPVDWRPSLWGPIDQVGPRPALLQLRGLLCLGLAQINTIFAPHFGACARRLGSPARPARRKTNSTQRAHEQTAPHRSDRFSLSLLADVANTRNDSVSCKQVVGIGRLLRPTPPPPQTNFTSSGVGCLQTSKQVATQSPRSPINGQSANQPGKLNCWLPKSHPEEVNKAEHEVLCNQADS